MRGAAVLAALALIGAAARADAGPWATGRGHYYAKLSYQHLRSTTLVAPDGTAFDIPEFYKDEAYLYGSFGLSERWTAIANVPLVRSANLHDEPDELGRESGFGDVQVGLQYQLGHRGPWVFAGRGLVQAPTGDETRAQGLLPTGSGIWEAEGRLGAGRSLGGGKGWGYVEAGYQYRGGGLRDGLVYEMQVGWSLAKRIAVAGNLRGVEPFSREAGSRTAGSFVGVGDRVTYVAVGPSLLVGLGRGWGVQLDFDTALHARNLARGPTYRVGFYHSR